MSVNTESHVTEHGFLVLDHCDVFVTSGGSGTCSKDESTIGPWFDVDIPTPLNDSEWTHHETHKSKSVPEVLRSSTDSGDSITIDVCSKCYLVLEGYSSFKATRLVKIKNLEGTNELRYDGTIRDTKCHCCSGKQRSDAALMMGLALMSQDLGHIAIQSIKFGLYDTTSLAPASPNADHDAVSHNNNPTDRKTSCNSSIYRKEKVCILITFSCREITGLNLPNQQRRFCQPVVKHLLHPATQLIISIMDSDWNDYENKIDELLSWSRIDEYSRKRSSHEIHTIDNVNDDENRRSSDGICIQTVRQRTSPLSFFPSKMNLEDVFQRISGISSSSSLCNPEFHPKLQTSTDSSIEAMNSKFQNDESNSMRTDTDRRCNNKSNECDSVLRTPMLNTLPTDILCHNIGQYLRARSLDSLRCTCQYLHWTLRLVVPGLNLKLYSHQIKSLMWMRSRESNRISEDDLLVTQKRRRRQRQKASQSHCMTHWIKNTPDRDTHRSATGGGTFVLRPRRRQDLDVSCDDNDTNLDRNTAPMRISQFDLSEIIEKHNYKKKSTITSARSGAVNPLARKIARGGLLCDDPGLGKTVTVISLILQTMGLSTEKKVDKDSKQITSHILGSAGGSPTNHEGTKNVDQTEKRSVHQSENNLSPNNEQIFDEYWKEQIIPEFQCNFLTKLFSTFLRCSRDINFFYDNYWIEDIQSSGISVEIKVSYSLKDIRLRINKSVYKDSFAGFVSDVEYCFQNALSNDHVSDLIRQAAKQLIVLFRNQIKAFKRSQIEIAVKSFSRSSAKPDSLVAALIERNNSGKLKRTLLPSSGTLMVVPAVLVDHWMEQVRLNINFSYCTRKIPVIFEFTGSNKSNQRIKETRLKCLTDKTHFPLVFVDRTATKKLPSPSFLAMFVIVLTTNNRFSREWKNGSFEDELRRNRKQSGCGGKLTNFSYDFAISEEACPLLKINWLRMIVDEGHSMGRGRDNSSIFFASWINAERRWAMTGTPTPQTSSQSGLINILNLMQYLKHHFFTRRHGGDIIWTKLIVKSWNIGFVSAFFRLRSLLSMLMIRHIKSDISEIPLPIFSTNTLSMGFEEISTYNTLVCAIQSNLVITSMKGKTSGAQDSLLHKSQLRHAREALSNLRLVCAGGTHVRPTLTAEYWIEFHQDFDNGNADPVQQKKIRAFITRATTGEQSKCDCCSVMLSTLLVFPCGHLVCTECVDSNTTSCVVCDKDFDVDQFQRLQPGFKYEWLHNVEEETKQQSKANDENVQDTNVPLLLPGGHGLLVPYSQRRRLARTHKYGDGHICAYSPKNYNGQCILCFTEHDPCFLVGERRCRVCYRVAQDCPTSESKISHIIEMLLELHRQHQERKKSIINENKQGYKHIAFKSGRRRTPKVIIFSQFRKVLNITGDRLLRRFGSGLIAEYWGKYRKKELRKFIKDERCLCMLLGKDGSEGLDLSFVTHIIFLEQVWDKSLENQVVARAWRMGAKDSVVVETLVAENSIEQALFLLERNSDDDRSDINGSTSAIQNLRSAAEDKHRSEYQHAKVHYLLNTLKLIVNANNLGLGASHKRKTCEDLQICLDTQAGTKIRAEQGHQKRFRVKFNDR